MRTFFIIWFGQLISIIGTKVTRFALGIWAFQVTGSATDFALVQLCNVVPAVLLAPVAGMFVDRVNRRTMMMLSDALAALSSIFLLVQLQAGGLELWHVYVVSIIGAAAETFQLPSYSAAIAQITPKDQFTRANSLVEMANGAGSLLSPLIAAALMSFIGIKGVILLDLVSFSAAIACLLLIRIPPIPRSPEAEHSGRKRDELLAGYRFLRRHIGLFLLVALFAVSNFSAAMFMGLLTPMVLSFSTVAMLGVIASAEGAGLIGGSVVMSIWGGPKKLMPAIIAVELLCGLCVILAVIQPSILLLGVAAFIYSFLVPVSSSCVLALWQRKVPHHLQGRVYSFRSIVTTSMMPLALAICGPLSDHVLEPAMQPNGVLASSVGLLMGVGDGRGMALLLASSGVLTILATAACLLNPNFRRLEEQIPDAH